MEFLSNPERRGIEMSIEMSIEQGIQRGIELRIEEGVVQGMALGEQTGERRGLTDALVLGLELHFGAAGLWLLPCARQVAAQIDLAHLHALVSEIKTAPSLTAFEAALAKA